MCDDQENQDDDDWLALVAGQAVPDADPTTQREARALREAILAEQHRDCQAADHAAFDGLLARLQREKSP
jgi:hypothetical protein